MDVPRVDRERLKQIVVDLSRNPRPAESQELIQARELVSASLTEAGWAVTPHSFSGENPMAISLDGINLIARHPSCFTGDKPRLCVGAHLDSVSTSPGADDNASAVAALLEIARLLPQELADAEIVCDLELIAFDLEEHGMLGGAEHARLMRETSITLVGMISLEMLGYCDQRPGSQTLLPELAGRYPDTGNFIGVVGNTRSVPFRQSFCQGMQSVKELPVEWLDVPGNGEVFPPTRLSDHSPFWDLDFPALMVTDTSFLRNPHYHTPGDTWETLDYEFLQRVAEGCIAGIKRVLQFGAV